MFRKCKIYSQVRVQSKLCLYRKAIKIYIRVDFSVMLLKKILPLNYILSVFSQVFMSHYFLLLVLPHLSSSRRLRLYPLRVSLSSK